MSLKENTFQLLKKNGISINANRDEQQLIDPNVISSLIRSADVTSSDTVLEIGPGIGNITVELASIAKKAIAIEKNPLFMPILRERLKTFNVELIEGDALKSELPFFNKLVSNIPYSISEAIIQKLARQSPEKAAIIFPSRFISRIFAAKGDPVYSKLSYVSSLFFNLKKMGDIPREAYYPMPSTDTMVVTLSPRLEFEPWELVIRSLHIMGNKKVSNGLREALISSNFSYPRTKREANTLIKNLGIKNGLMNKRVAQLSLEELQYIAKLISNEFSYDI